MPHKVPSNSKKGPHRPPLLRSEIENAQAHTNSNAGAARFLDVSYERYRRYAKLYNLFDSHMNITGIGITKGYGSLPSTIPIKDILAGKHPKYSLAKLKNRLIARKKMVEECRLCGFNERRITDKKVPLMMAFKDGDRHNMALENLELLCYNCMFLTTGAPTVVYRGSIEKSFVDPDHIRPGQDLPRTHSDSLDIVEDADDQALRDADVTLTPEEMAELQEDENLDG